MLNGKAHAVARAPGKEARKENAEKQAERTMKLAARELARKPTRARNQLRASRKLAARELAREPARGRNHRKEKQAIEYGMDSGVDFLQQSACCPIAFLRG